jgi:large subunit ribosomal protein L3
VLQVKTAETQDGYNALQLGFADKREKNTSKPLVGHVLKAGSPCKLFVREIRLEAPPAEEIGADVTVSIFEKVQKVDVQGLTKGKGFAGVMKRWNFKGLGASHGASKRHRSPGALGRHMSISKGVPKGKKMAGHLGQEKVTVQGLRVATDLVEREQFRPNLPAFQAAADRVGQRAEPTVFLNSSGFTDLIKWQCGLVGTYYLLADHPAEVELLHQARRQSLEQPGHLALRDRAGGAEGLHAPLDSAFN